MQEGVKYRFKDVVDSLDYNELTRMKKDIDAGGFHLKKFLDEKMKEQEAKHECCCSNCSATINPNNVNTYTIIFGPHDFRKKATFCGMDCLEYFLGELKQIKRVVK